MIFKTSSLLENKSAEKRSGVENIKKFEIYWVFPQICHTQKERKVLLSCQGITALPF